MSLRTASCPGCGATLEFRNAATLTLVCPFCGSANYRSDVDIERLGKVAEVQPIESPLAIGSEGTADGKRWTAIGQVQLDHGAGPWNEWCLLLDDGSWAWLAEAQGEFLLTKRVETPAGVPSIDSLHPGDDVEVGPAGRFTVAEVGKGRIVAAKGELPFRAPPGGIVRYADIRGTGGRFGTLDYGQGTACEAVYVGTVVKAEDLGIDPTRVAEAIERRAAASRLSCPSCGGIIELRDPAGTVRVVCQSCGSLIDPTAKVARVLGIGAALKAVPKIPIGSKGALRGEAVEIIAFLIRSVTAEGKNYPWSEYLLKTARGSYLWLVESEYHWNQAETVSLADVKAAGIRGFRGRDFRHFQGGDARVDHVQGEVYWEVAVGDTVKADDYVDPPYMLTLESDAKERIASLSTYTEPEEVQAAFGLSSAFPKPAGAGPNQPNPWAGALGAWWGSAAALLAAALLLTALASHGAPAGSGGEVVMGIVVAGLLAIPPIVVTTRRSNFEVARWAESDDPVRGGGGDGDD